MSLTALRFFSTGFFTTRDLDAVIPDIIQRSLCRAVVRRALSESSRSATGLRDGRVLTDKATEVEDCTVVSSIIM